MSVKNYDLTYVPEIRTGAGDLAYGNSPYIAGSPVLGPRGLPVIEMSDIGLGSMNEGVATVFHEIYHQNMLAAFGVPGSEAAAEAYGQSMLARFLARMGG